MSFDDIRNEPSIATRILAELGLASGMNNSVGHASLRVPGSPDRFIIKGRGHDMDVVGLLRPEDSWSVISKQAKWKGRRA